MGKRAWLETAIASEYIPFLSSLDDSEEGILQAAQFNQTIRNSWSDRGLTELSQQQSLMDITRRAIKDHLGEKHFSLDCIKFDTDEYIQLNDAKQGRVAERNEQVQFLDNPDAIVEKAIALLNSPEWSQIAAGLSVLTGRRSSELLSTAQFTKCGEWSVTFTGALKRRGETQILSFEIPTLSPADTVCQALTKVRQQLPDAIAMEADVVNSKYGSAVIRECDRHFADLVPAREGKDNLYTHLFRSIYATIATFWFCPPSVNEVEFKAAIQGHYAILDENNPERKRSLIASRHYSDYEIADAVIAGQGGKRKGVKLGTKVTVIEAFRERTEVREASQKIKKKLGSVRIWRDDRPLLDALFNQLGLDGSLNQSSKMNQLLIWVKAHLDLEPIISESESVASTPSQTHPLQDELELEKTTPDDEQAQITVAVSLPSKTDDLAPPQIGDQESPKETASSLEAKIDHLVDVMTQFIDLQMQNATQQSNHHPTRVKVEPITQAQPKTAETATQESHQAAQNSAQRTSRNSPEAQEAINQAITAIIAHNNATELHDLKWAITINAVKELVSHITKSQRLVERAIAQRKDEIDAHHALHQLEPNHNHRHKRKRKINQVFS